MATLTDAIDEPEVRDGLEILASEGMASWLDEQNVSLVFGTPPSKMWMVGIGGEGELSIFDRTLDKVMGLATDQRGTILAGTRFEVWRFEDMLRDGQTTPDGHDRLFFPRVVRKVGNINIHDVGLCADGSDLIVNTRFGCLASTSDEVDFIPRWYPPFLDRRGQGDCCHLNGLAMEDGAPRYVSCVSTSTTVDSWREGRRDQGVLIDVATNEIVARGLSMPHSPRMHEGGLWVANAGTGELCRVDPITGSVEPVAFGPGFLRGLSFVGPYAVVGSSKPRRGDLYSGLPLDDALAEHGMDAHLGIFVIDTRTGDLVHWLLIEGKVRELFDVCVLENTKRPAFIGLQGPEIASELWFDDQLPGHEALDHALGVAW